MAKSLIPQVSAAVLLFALLLAGSGSAAASSLAEVADGKGALRKVVFVHRHCARTPMVNTDHSCNEIGCGMCTEQGELMLKSTGESFREKYGSILPDKYLPKRGFVSLSDRIHRTIQSSAAFLRGLFAFNSSYEVFTATETSGFDLLLPWAGEPGYHLHYDTTLPGLDEYLGKNVTEYLTFDTIMKIALEANYNTTVCANDLVDCTDKLSDFIFSVRAQGQLDQYPTAATQIHELKALRNYRTQLKAFSYDLDVLNDGYFDRAGWPAHPLYDDILENCGNWNDPDKTSKGDYHEVFMHEYSGHDSTLEPLYSAMGNYSWVYPEFATSLVFEVYNNSVNASGEPFVVVKTTLPGQLPGSHPIQWLEYEVTCMNANNQLYNSADGCPLSDLKRFAATRRGGAKRQMVGPCYAEYSDLVAQNCTDTTGVKPTNKNCISYRMACPLNGCGKGAYMREDYSCMSL